MRVAYLVSQYPASSHTFIRREVLALRARGIEVQTFSVRRPAAEECTSDDDRAARDETVYVLPASPRRIVSAHAHAAATRPGQYLAALRSSLDHRVPGTHGLTRSVIYFVEAIVLARELERSGAEHLHNHFANAGANVGRLAAGFLGLPWSLTLHGISETDYPAGVMLAKKIRAARFVVCVSYYGLAQAMRLVPPDQWPKLFVGRCALDLDALPPRSAETHQRRRVICVGRLSAEKGHHGLLQAFRAVRDGGTDVELVLVGDGPDRDDLVVAVGALELTEHVTFLGRLPERDTLAEIARSDVLVLASFMEGLPVVLMEAMALQVPVIAARVAGIPELVDDGEEGLLFTPGRWSELTESLDELLADAGLRAKMGRAGRAKVESEFEIGRAVTPLADRLVEVNAGRQ